jgi:uncharacterized protein
VKGTVSRACRRRRGGSARVTPTLALIGLVLLLVAPALAAKAVPFLAGQVNDGAGIVPGPVRERLETKLQDLERRTGAQVAVLTVDSLEGDPIEDYAVRVFQTWKLGRQGVNDGALLVVARQERRMRIEVGYGLEERLTDARSRQILDDIIRPHFRDGNFGAGIEAGVNAMATVIEGASLPPPRKARSQGIESTIGLLVMGGIFILLIGTFSMVALVAPGGVAWFLYLFLVPFYAAFPTAMFPPYGGIIAGGAWLILFPIVRAFLKSPQGKEFRKRHGWVPGPGDGGRWRTSGGGFSGGGSGGGGGFSGGGGSSGGGGASSSW